ncbi:aconitase family protein [Bordetella bronchiseptica RB50]|uniref:Aconitase family protein n=3 Tax=Bordetella bronchiseptica TaxID=518 RepID=A0A0H3LHG4_BORBR|nr:aconitase [Bordetella bronchiseptica]CAE31066.1 aconitase family protein [Bordetella bronchiseptica RB50]CCN21337.1 aconitase family protein [Bordetella bronchiseptica 1289]
MAGMGKTMTEKILSAAAGRNVSRGDFGWAKVHVVSMIDALHFCDWDFFDRNQVKVWDPSRVVFSFDHLAYPGFGLGVQGLGRIRDWARRHGVPNENIFDIGRNGISHQVPAEHGWVLPGTVYIGADTQAATLGAFNCFAIPALAETPFIMATGDTWFKVPPCVRIRLSGRLPKGVLGKDIYLRLLQDLRGKLEGCAIEFDGPGVATMPLDVRMAVANGAPHIGATTMIFPSDDILLDYLRPRAREAFAPVAADGDAAYDQAYEYDLASFEPLIAGPDDPGRISPLRAMAATRIHAAYIGSCSSGRLEDLTQAAEVLRGRKISPDVRMVVTPISTEVMLQAVEAGLVAAFVEAGATVTAPGCGACFYGNASPLHLEDGENCITGSVENWPGRMGSNKASIYLANAAVVAASALAGHIADPDMVRPSNAGAASAREQP